MHLYKPPRPPIGHFPLSPPPSPSLPPPLYPPAGRRSEPRPLDPGPSAGRRAGPVGPPAPACARLWPVTSKLTGGVSALGWCGRDVRDKPQRSDSDHVPRRAQGEREVEGEMRWKSRKCVEASVTSCLNQPLGGEWRGEILHALSGGALMRRKETITVIQPRQLPRPHAAAEGGSPSFFLPCKGRVVEKGERDLGLFFRWLSNDWV